MKFSLFDTLVRRHPDGTLHPALATAWQRTAPTTWQLTLRPDVRWHDGARFTSFDAKYSLDRTYDATLKAARLSSFFQTIDRTEAPDPGTLVIHSKRPDPLIPAKLAYCGQIVPWAYIDRVGFTVFNQRPVGTGPLRFVSWTKGDACVLAANPDYWDGRLELERVIFRPVPEPRGARGRVAPWRRRSDHPARARSRRAGGDASVDPGGRRPVRWPLRPPRQRLGEASERPPGAAGAVAGDRQGDDREGALARAGRGAERADPPGRHSLRPRAAAAALRPTGSPESTPAAGYRGEPVVLETTVGFIANDKAMTEMIAEMWEDVGVKVVVEVIDNEVRHRKYRQQTFKGLSWSDPTSTTRDPDGMMGRLLGPDTPHDYWRHPEFDRLVIAARLAGDESVRADAYRRMTAIFLEHNPWIVVLQPYEDCGFRRYVEFTPSPDQQLELRRFNFRMRRS